MTYHQLTYWITKKLLKKIIFSAKSKKNIENKECREQEMHQAKSILYTRIHIKL